MIIEVEDKGRKDDLSKVFVIDIDKFDNTIDGVELNDDEVVVIALTKKKDVKGWIGFIVRADTVIEPERELIYSVSSATRRAIIGLFNWRKGLNKKDTV